jgi:hypothetical protein
MTTGETTKPRRRSTKKDSDIPTSVATSTDAVPFYATSVVAGKPYCDNCRTLNFLTITVGEPVEPRTVCVLCEKIIASGRDPRILYNK